MSVTATIQGGNVFLSGNPVRVEVESSGAPAGCSNYKVLLKITPVYDVIVKGGPFIDGIAPDADGLAMFDIHGYVDVNVPIDFHWPVVNAVTGHINRTIDLQVQPGESWIDENGDLQEQWGATSETFFVIKGGVSDHTLAQWTEDNTNFENEYVAAARFLTNLPRSMKVLPGQFVKLCMLFPYGDEFDSTVKTTVYYSDDTSEEFETEYTAYTDALYEFDLNLQRMGVEVENADRKVMYYEVVVSTDGGWSETFTFTIDWTYYEDPAQLFFLNSLGGIDCIALTGDVESGFDAESIEAVMPLQPDATAKSRTVIVASRKGSHTWKINTGWKERAVMEALADALVSKMAWLYYREKLYPVTIANTSTPLGNKFSNLQSADITMTLAHNSPYV